MGIKPKSAYKNMWSYYIIIVVYPHMFLSHFVAIFREVFLQRIYYKDNQTNVLIQNIDKINLC